MYYLCYYNSQLHDLVSRTVDLGESNSILVIGPRGCGKSMVSDLVLYIHIYPYWNSVTLVKRRTGYLHCPMFRLICWLLAASEIQGQIPPSHNL